MGKNPWMKFYVKDYMMDIDVKALTYEEKGLYTDMLFLMWDNGGVLPGDMTELSKILGISCKKFTKKFQKISKFFQKVETDGKVFLTQKRLNKEWNKAEQISDKRSQAGQKGGIASQSQRQANAKAKAQANDKQMLKQKGVYTESESDTDTEKDLKESSSVEAEKNGTRSSKGKAAKQQSQEFDYQVSLEQVIDTWNKRMPEYGLAQVVSCTKARERAFKARILEMPDVRNSLDWWEGIFASITQSSFLKGQKGGSWKMDFDWLIGCGTRWNPETGLESRDGTELAKIQEGKYVDPPEIQFGRTLHAVNEKDYFDPKTGSFDSIGYNRARHGYQAQSDGKEVNEQCEPEVT